MIKKAGEIIGSGHHVANFVLNVHGNRPKKARKLADMRTLCNKKCAICKLWRPASGITALLPVRRCRVSQPGKIGGLFNTVACNHLPPFPHRPTKATRYGGGERV